MLKQAVYDQYREKFFQVANDRQISRPKEGWLRSMRKALGMSSPQMAKRLKISKSQASQMERMEAEDRITLKLLRRVADSLDCDLEYALVPRRPLAEMVRERARIKAERLVYQADVQMKLAAKQLGDDILGQLIDNEVERLVRDLPRELWED